MKSFVLFVVIDLCFGTVAGHFQLQIVHNNDMHARFAETDKFSASCPSDYAKNNQCYGGYARTKQAAVDAIEEANKRNISSIFLNAGDSFQGTPYYTIYKWKIVAPLVDALGIDVMSLGNHEFDDGIDNLVEYLNHLKTPVVACNLNLSSESRLNVRNLMPSVVLNVNGHSIGVIGYLTPDTKFLSNTENLEIFDEIPKLKEEAKRLKAKGVKIIIGLGHSGFEKDIKIAQEVDDISLVVGGHSHSLLYSPKDKPPSSENVVASYPYIVTQKSGKIVPVVQAYAFTKYIGKLMVTFDDDGNVISATGNTVVLDSSFGKDSSIDKEVGIWTASLRQRLGVVKGYTRVFLQKSNFLTNEFESNIMNLVTDAIVDSGVEISKQMNVTQWTNAPLAAYQNGGIRSTIDNIKNGGAITLEDILTLLPFKDALYICSVPGFVLKESLEFSVSKYDKTNKFNYLHYFINYSGLRVVYNLNKPPGNRVENIKVICTNCFKPKYEAFDEKKIYNVILTSFLIKGGDNFFMFSKHITDKQKLNITDTDVLISYIEKMKIVYPIIDGRIVVNGFQENTSAAHGINVSFCLIFLMCVVSSIRYTYYFII